MIIARISAVKKDSMAGDVFLDCMTDKGNVLNKSIGKSALF